MSSKLLLTISAVAFLFLPAASRASSAPPVTVKMMTAEGKDAGTINLTEKRGGVNFKLDLMNLPPGEHAIHVHEFAKCEGPSYGSSGYHLNPDKKMHGMKDPDGPHAGDIPLNLKVGSDGTEKNSFMVKTLSLDPSAPNSVFANGGTSIIIHAQGDDMETDPGGNSGPRIACGLILPPAK